VNLATIGWPSGTDTGWPSEPRNMLPGRIEGYPQGSQRSANTAERLLSQAVGWWDAAAYRDGDRLLRNRGVAGELLDLQLGSSDRVATTNDPLFLAPEDQGYVYLPGGSANRLQVPDEAALDITGDITITARVALEDWTPAAVRRIVAKWLGPGNQRSYEFRINANGTLEFGFTTNGATVLGRTSTVAPTVADGNPLWIACTLDVDNGASGHDVRFFTSNDGVTWTQLGSTVTTAGTTSIFAGTAPLTIGSESDGTNSMTGKVYRATVANGIGAAGVPGGTTVLDIDCDAITDGSATSFTAVTGQTVTINRSTSGRKSVAVPSNKIKKIDDAHIYCQGTVGNFLFVQNNNSFNITEDFDIRVRVGAELWARDSGLLAKSEDGPSQTTFRFQTNANRNLLLRLSTNGSTLIDIVSTSTIPFIDGSNGWLRVTFDANNNNNGYDVKFFTSPDSINEPISWTQLGSTITTSPQISLFNGTAPIRFGAITGQGTAFRGKIYRAIIYLDLNEQNKILDIDCSKITSEYVYEKGLTFLANTNQDVTLQNNFTSDVFLERSGRGSSLFLFGGDDYMQVINNFQHQLLNIEGNDSFTILLVHRVFSDPSGDLAFFSKWSNTNVGWRIGIGPANRDYNTISAFDLNGTRNVFQTWYGVSCFGQLQIFSHIYNYFNRFGGFRRNGVFLNRGQTFKNSLKQISTLGLFNNTPVRIGASAELTQFAHMEFYAAAIFRRALTANEIKIINNYYLNRGL